MLILLGLYSLLNKYLILNIYLKLFINTKLLDQTFFIYLKANNSNYFWIKVF